VRQWQKTLALLAALLLVLSPLGSTSVLAWVHADGTVCHTCSHATTRAVETACCPHAMQLEVKSPDCKVCCSPQKSAADIRQSTFAAMPAIMPAPTRLLTFCVIGSCFRIVESSPLSRRILRSPPSLRAPPSIQVV
jgi:hypothetical protein